MKIDTILERTLILFLNAGFSKTNTDEISEFAGVSKRTLYKYFITKEKLIDAVISKLEERIRLDFEKILSDKEQDSLSKLYSVMKFVTENSSKISKTFFRDIELYRPDIYEKMKMTRRLRIKSLVGILKEGQKSGTIRSDIDPQFAIDCLVAAAEEVLKPTNLSEKEYGGKSAYQMLFQIIIEGIKNK